MVLIVFFFKQKTAYEMRISDWSSDVCSSDLLLHFVDCAVGERHHFAQLLSTDGPLDWTVISVSHHRLLSSSFLGNERDRPRKGREEIPMSDSRIPWRTNRKLSDRVIDASISHKSCGAPTAKEIGRASCRESVCQYV